DPANQTQASDIKDSPLYKYQAMKTAQALAASGLTNSNAAIDQNVLLAGQSQQQMLNNSFSLYNTGAQAAAALAAQAQGFGGQIAGTQVGAGNAMAGGVVGAANAQAGGIAGAANAFTGAVGTGLSYSLYGNLLSK